MVELYLDETDLDKIAVGNEVKVASNVLPDEVCNGQVVRVESQSVRVEGVPTVQAVTVREGQAEGETWEIAAQNQEMMLKGELVAADTERVKQGVANGTLQQE
jgi:hypothetical protein